MTTTDKKAQPSLSRRLEKALLIILILLITLLLSKGIIERFSQVSSSEQTSSRSIVHHGLFIQHTLNTLQLDALQHMVNRIPDQQMARLYLSKMTLEEKIGQLIQIQYNTGTYAPDLEQSIQELHVGGVILYQWQMRTFEQTHNDILQMQKHTQIPLFISTDEEGGYVDRIINIYPRRLGATEIFSTGDPQIAAREGNHTARDLLALGINTNMAPDVDVPLINGPDQITRTFGNTAEEVTRYAGAYLEAMQKAGVVGCVKHYPGLGSATIDAHQGLPIINRTREQIYAVDLAPYKTFLQDKNSWLYPAMIMATDLLMPAIDPSLPAELSPIFITDILRKELHYDGVITTDALYMRGISAKWSLPQAAVLALKAGNDMLMGSNGFYETRSVVMAIKQAVEDGTLSEKQLDEAVSRVLTLKLRAHVLIPRFVQMR